MNTNVRRTPRVGDLLRRPKAILTKHVGVYAGNGWVFHNAPAVGPSLVEWNRFAGGHRVEVLATKVDSRLAAERIRIQLASRKPYDLVTSNCEHAAFEVISGQRMSPQVQLAGLALLVGAVLLVAKNS